MLNGLGFAFAVIRFNSAFTIFFLLYAIPLYFYIVKHRRPYFVVGAIRILSID